MDTKQKAWIFANENPEAVEPSFPRRYKRETTFIGRMGTDRDNLIAILGEEKYLKMLEEDKITGAEKDARNERLMKDL